jgi:uncharacterized membrane protein YccC
MVQRLTSLVRARWRIGLRAALSIGLPLVIGVLIGKPDWGALASVGGLAGVYGGDTPQRHRIRLVAAVGLALAIVVPLSSLCANVTWLSVVYVGAVAGVASLCCLGLRVPPPREYLLILAVLVATGMPADLGGALRECVQVAAGVVVSLAVAVAVGPRAGLTPAVNQAWNAVADLLRTAGTQEAPAARRRAIAAFAQTRDVLWQAGATADELRSPAAAEIVFMAAISASIDAREPLNTADWEPALSGLREGRPVPPTATTRPGLRSAFIAAAYVLRPDSEVAELERIGVVERLREAVHSVALPAAARIGVGVTLGAALGHELGLAHAYWVALTVAAVLLGTNLTVIVRRTWHRIAGTIVGVGLAAAVFTSHPTPLTVAFVALAAQFVAELLMPLMYALGVALVTLIPIALYHLANPGSDIGTALGARTLDTVIGAALAVALRLVLWPKATAARLPQVQAATLRAVTDLYRARWLTQTSSHSLRREVHRRWVELHNVNQDVLADQVRGGSEQRDEVTPALDELAILSLGVPFGRPLPPRAEAEALLLEFDRIADDLQDGKVPQAAPEPLVLPGYPRTSAAARLLASAVIADSPVAKRSIVPYRR